MRLRRIMAVILAHGGKEFFDKAEILEVVFWWLRDVLLLGFLSKSFGALTGNALFGSLIIVSVITMRPTVIRGAMTMARLIVDELSGNMFLATLATPITRTEWTIASMIISFLQAALRLILGYLLIFLLFDINVFSFGFALLATIPFFVISGWIIGFLTSACVYIVGKRSITQLQVLSFSFIALCGVYSPVSALPTALQKVSWCLPVTYILTGLREHILTGVSIWPFLLKNLALNMFYALIALIILYLAFRHAKQRGLAHLETK